MEKTGRYNTKQRDRIMDYLTANQHCHITVEDVVEYFKTQGNPIGTSTVYRYLDVLVKEGTVRKFNIEEGCAACFQYAGASHECVEHFHLKCSTCGKLFHIQSDSLAKAKAEVAEKYGFQINPLKTVLYGDCSRCRNEE